MKRWQELTGEEQMLAKKLPMSAQIEHGARKKHLFCTRCWHEETSSAPTLA